MNKMEIYISTILGNCIGFVFNYISSSFMIVYLFQVHTLHY